MPHESDFGPDADGLAAALRTLIELRGAPGDPHVEVDSIDLPAELPEEGLGGQEALATLAGSALRVSRLDHRGFFAHMDPPTPWFTWAAAQWAAAVNQNLLHPDTGARHLERLAVEWVAPAFGMGGGHLVPGSTVANLTALWAARELTGARRVVASAAAHLSVAKAANLLGLELVSVPVDERQRLRVDALPDDLSGSILVLVAGTVATGAVDPLTVGAGAAWRHVDAAWAGALRLSSHAGLLAGIEAADSVSLSAHKWLYQPKDCAAILFREPGPAHDALTFGAGYLAVPNVGLLGSSGNRALPLVATLLAWGRAGLAGRIDSDMAVAERLGALVAAEAELDLWHPPVTGIVNWRPRDHAPAAVRARLRDAWVSIADIAGTPWFRSVAANPLADPEHVVTAMLRAVRE